MILSLAVQSLMTFNLVCTGSSLVSHETRPMSGDFRLDGKRGLRPMSFVYRIDLEASRFCVEKCAETQPIASVTYGDIVLEDETEKFSGATIYTSIKRESGSYFAYRDTRVRRKVERVMLVGTCKTAPFSGFPERKF